MLARTLPALAYALGAAANADEAFVRLSDALTESDRDTVLALLHVDPRTGLIRERARAVNGRIEREGMETSVEQLPVDIHRVVAEGGSFAEVGEDQAAYARLLRLPEPEPGGLLLLRGIRHERQLVAILAAVEPKRVFGTRVTERLGPLAALFELAVARFVEQDSRAEAVRTLEAVTQRVHQDYLARLAELEARIQRQTSEFEAESASTRLARERDDAKRTEEARRSARQLTVLEQQLTASIGQLEQAHVELHRRSEALRQRTRTLYLLDRVLSLSASTAAARPLVDGLLTLLGDDMQALRCSIFLRDPAGDTLYLAAARGLAPHVQVGHRVAIGQGIVGRVAASREPMLVVDVQEAATHPLLKDEYLTTGSFISFPLVRHDTLIGVVNLTNRAQRGLFVEEDVERVRLLGLVISLVATEARLPDRLLGSAA
ncbi:GAF domain-containing protein [Pseudogemmatithrix spongiicola]|uniref:GAF domain-containing protein n=1 Tax=Pseudogemmatithrix spongiicola TaxID=3062599 RepID=A0AA49JUU2_9BACT|nr:GAF domain-containing protein [Gemmatimonadaceae bacterium 'strain 138']WKW15227.1 GAF domain-containing protein [Gemmatimonadaceae bacterium 'strain 318']